MRLVLFRNGRFEAFGLDTRTRSDAKALEKAIRSFANAKGDIDCLSVQIGTEYIPVCHVDEARMLSRLLTADHDCFTDHFYENGFEEVRSSTAAPANTPADAYKDNELWKLEFEYEQHADLGTPCFGSSKAHEIDIF